MNSRENFINNLRELILLDNLTVKKFSSGVGINRRSVSSWFYSRSPKLESLKKIADYFDCSIDYLLGRTENRKLYRSETPVDFFTRYSLQKNKYNLTDYQIAKRCRIRTSTVAKWKDGVIPVFEILVKLCEIFDCSFEFLVGRCDF